MPPIRSVLHCTRFFYLDSSNGAAIANRALMEYLARRGFAVSVLSGTVTAAAPGSDPATILAARDPACQVQGAGESDCWVIGGAGVRRTDPPRVVATVDGVPVTTLRRPLRDNGPTDPNEAADLLTLFDAALERFRPDVLVTYGGDPLTREILARARRNRVATVFTLHNLGYSSPDHFANVDAVLVPSRFAAEHYRRVLGRECVAIPCLVDPGRVRAERTAAARYVTFVNPTVEKGVCVFARIADELGRRRPEIPLLVVESRGDEARLVGCGLDLRNHGNVFLMSPTDDPRDFWRVTRLALMPSLCRESQGLVAVEALVNGIPVLVSDRGALPETVGPAGLVLPLPARLTATSRLLPTAAEVAPWVEAILRLWDDPTLYAAQQRHALAHSHQWDPDTLGPDYQRVFEALNPGPVLSVDLGRTCATRSG